MIPTNCPPNCPPNCTDRTIYIVDDDAAARDSLALLLGLHGYRTQSFAAAEDFLSAIPSGACGCLVLDLRMPGLDGLGLQRRLNDAGSVLPVIFISAHGDIAATRDTMKAGAVDFLQKPVDDMALIAAIEEALERSKRIVSEAGKQAEFSRRKARLTERERQVMEAVVRGLPNREIAVELDISPRTVEVYKARMMEKLGTRSLADLIRLVLGQNAGG